MDRITRGADRRQTPRRDVDRDVHYAEQLVIATAVAFSEHQNTLVDGTGSVGDIERLAVLAVDQRDAVAAYRAAVERLHAAPAPIGA